MMHHLGHLPQKFLPLPILLAQQFAALRDDPFAQNFEYPAQRQYQEKKKISLSSENQGIKCLVI